MLFVLLCSQKNINAVYNKKKMMLIELTSCSLAKSIRAIHNA